MKKILMIVLILFTFLIFNTEVKAENLGVGIFCDKYLKIENGKIAYDFEKAKEEKNYKYIKDDEVLCYISIYYDGDVPYNQVSFELRDTNEFEFIKFEKGTLYDNVQIDDNKYTVKSNKGVVGSSVVGILHYKMLVGGDDLNVSIGEFYIENFEAVGYDITGTVNNSSGQEIPFDHREDEDDEPGGEVIDNPDIEDVDIVDSDSMVYVYMGISFIIFILILIAIIIKKHLKDKNLFE